MTPCNPLDICDCRQCWVCVIAGHADAIDVPTKAMPVQLRQRTLFDMVADDDKGQE